ncbi:MAG: hypothetical protein FJ030_14970 [Chloroflexi bacterium]|nr:hypothetical protein [Chloroflexota bacterium]
MSDFNAQDRWLKTAESLQAWRDAGQKGPCPVTDWGGLTPPAELSQAESLPTVIELPAATTAAAPEEETSASRGALPQQESEAEERSPSQQASTEESESPEQRTLRAELETARQHLQKNELRQAVALSSAVASRASDPKLKEAAADAHDRARRKLNEQLDRALADGDAAREKGQTDDARRHYKNATELDPDNSHARRALLELNGAFTARLSENERKRLKAGLEERKDIKRLGEAVYFGEALKAEEKLSGELLKLLERAREAFDNLRKAHGEETTMMRFGDLAARKAARNNIEARVARREQYIFDPTTNEDRPAHQMLQIADKLLEERSEDTAQHEIDRIAKLLPAHPRGAKQRLEAALQQPFHEQHRRLLVDKEVEITKLLAAQEGAETKLAEADASVDEVEVFGLIRQAHGAFPHLPGLAERAAQARLTAQETLAAQMRECHTNAESKLGAEDYKGARKEITRADALLARWPEEQKPASLLELEKVGEDLLGRAQTRETNHQEFNKFAGEIRARVVDPNAKASALQLFDQIRADQRFASFTELRVLISEMDQYRDVGENLAEARTAQAKGDWERAGELATKIRQSGKAGQFGEEVDAILAESVLEFQIIQAKRHLENDEVKEANRILSQLVGKENDKARKEALKERLKDEREEIEQAIKVDPPIKEFYDRAMAMSAAGRNMAERFEALKMLRYIGGEPVDDLPAGWPPYRLSLRTAESRREARKLADVLRADFLDPLKALHASPPNPLSDSLLALSADRARALREANLLDNEDERAVIRWVEVEWGKREARAKETAGDWDEAVSVWERLNVNHPRMPEVETGLRAARERKEAIEQALERAARELDNKRTKDALTVLQAALAEGLTKDAPKLIRVRDQIFGDAESAILTTVGDEPQKGGDESKIRAMQELLTLRELEDAAARPDSARRSTRKLEALRAELAPAAESVARNAQSFNPALYPLEAGLAAARQLADRLKSFGSMTQLFGEELSAIKEKLDSRQRRMNEMVTKLKTLQEALDGNQQSLWAGALRTDNFEPLNRIQLQIESAALDDLPPEVANFNERLSEFKEMHSHFVSKTAEIKQLFTKEENFGAVVTAVRQLKGRPDLRPNKQTWHQIDQIWFRYIRRGMCERLRIIDVYGGGQDLVGWGDVEQAAEARGAELEAWGEWDAACVRLMESADSKWNATLSHSAETQVIQRQTDWEAVKSAASAAIQKLEAGPRRGDQLALVHSGKAKEHSEEGRKRLVFARQWLEKAEIESAGIDEYLKQRGFPTPEEFDGAVKQNDWDRLERLLARARTVGAANDIERKRMATYEKTLQDGRKQKPGGWIDRLRDQFDLG